MKKSNQFSIFDCLEKPETVQYTVLSLFSGCGGMDLGFEGNFPVLKNSVNSELHPSWHLEQSNNEWVILPRTKFKTVFANDIRPDAQAAWVNYFSARGTDKNCYKLESIVNLVKEYRNGNTSIFPTNIDIVTGGFPCQDFSVAGKRQGFNSKKSHDGTVLCKDSPSIESRGQLYMWMREVISIVQPKVFFAENVKGLASLADTKEIIQHDFSTICDGGYLVVPARVLLAANYGVPQSRERIIFIGFRRNALTAKAIEELSKPLISEEFDPYPIITHSKQPLGKQLPFVTCQEAFIGLEEPHLSSDIDQTKYSSAKWLPKGQGNSEVNIHGVGPTIRSEHHGNIEFRRLSLEHGGKHMEELANGLLERRLTIRECARIQTFPDEYKFVIPSIEGRKNVTASDAYKIIGNAVPPLLGFNLAMRLQENWDKYFMH